LNLPTKDALLEVYKTTGRRYPRREDGRGGAPLVADMIRDLGDRAWAVAEPSKNQPAPYFARQPVYRDEADRRRQHNRIIQEALILDRARRGEEFLGKTPGPLHMPNCRGCAVREACEVHEAGGDFKSVLNATMVNWDPYAAHEQIERR
jgi:hypothetical protein